MFKTLVFGSFPYWGRYRARRRLTDPPAQQSQARTQPIANLCAMPSGTRTFTEARLAKAPATSGFRDVTEGSEEHVEKMWRMSVMLADYADLKTAV